MRLETIEIFNFHELDKNVQEKVIDKNRDINVDDSYWHECVIEAFHQILGFIGYYDIECSFSGFWSQGDGASFRAKYAYEKGALKKVMDFYPSDKELYQIVKNIQDLQKKNFYQLQGKIGKSGSNYCHSNTMVVDYLERNDGKEPTDEAELDFRTQSRYLAEWLYEALEAEYNFLTSDEAVIDSLKGYQEFTKDGEVI